MQRLEAVVIGAGHAGLAVSQRLAAVGIDHVVLERGRIGESWRSQRWDTFALNSPSWSNRLPGDADGDVLAPADGFATAPGFADRLARYAAAWRLPVREGAAVSTLARSNGGFEVEVGGPGGDRVAARSVVVASGIQNLQRVPPIAAALPAPVTQVTSLAYRNAAELPDGAVLVVGGGQTGVQLVEDLLGAGRRVYLSPSRVGRAPRRFRGREVFEWLVQVGFYEVRRDQVADPAELQARQPVISGVGRYGHTVSLQWLASRGATLVGRIRAVEGHSLLLDDTVADCIRFGDNVSAQLRTMLEAAGQAEGGPRHPEEDDPADQPHPDPDSVHSPERLDLGALGIRTVIWATGVRGEFGWLPPTVLDDAGSPVHASGSTALPGLFVVGFPWLTRRGSGIINGIGPDAQLIADGVAARAG